MSSEERSFIEQARRAQIVRCAIEVIAELGYAGASLAQIAKRARISKGVISYHFAGKDDLLGQVVTQVYTEGAEFMGEALATTETALQTLRVYLATNLDYIKNHRRSIAAVTEILRNLRD
ncbi:MAG: TetR/AcrR family transcriptional regulator, partial [Sciscionella sp.]